MKKILFFSVILYASLSLTGQDSLSVKSAGQLNSSRSIPLITIKGDEIRNFPSNNFLDAVNGLFPWVFSLTPNTNDFIFIVDGNLLIDINSLSLHQVESISFSRASLSGELYPFSRAGTFFITLKKATEGKPLLSINSQYNTAFSNTGRPVMVQPASVVLTQQDRGNSGHLFSTNASLLAKGKRWDLNISAQLDHLAAPELNQELHVNYINMGRKDTSIINGRKRQVNLRTFGQFNYTITDNLHVGVYGNYFHGKTNTDTASLFLSQNQFLNRKQKAAVTLPRYNGGVFADWVIVKGLHNRLSFEYAHAKLDGNSMMNTEFIAPQNPGYRSQTKSIDLASNRQVLLRNELDYTLISKPLFQAGVTAIFWYVNQKPRYKGSSATTSDNGMSSASGSSTQFDQKLTSLNGKFYFSYNQVLTGYAGYARLINKGFSRFSASSKNNPYAGLEINLKRLLKTGSAFSRLDLSLNYGDLTQNNASDYWLPEVVNTSQFVSSPVINNMPFIGFGPIVFPNPSLANILLKNRLITIQANAGFINNRLLAGVEWSQLRAGNLYFISTPFGGGPATGTFVKGKETRSGLSIYMSSKLVEQTSREWTLRLNAVIPRTEHKIEAANYPLIRGNENQLQLGIQNNIRLQNWYVQVNGLAAINKTTVNSFLVNYLIAGYTFAGTKNDQPKLSVFAHGRNLFASGTLKNFYDYYTYAGVGVNIIL